MYVVFLFGFLFSTRVNTPEGKPKDKECPNDHGQVDDDDEHNVGDDAERALQTELRQGSVGGTVFHLRIAVRDVVALKLVLGHPSVRILYG